MLIWMSRQKQKTVISKCKRGANKTFGNKMNGD